MKSSTPMTDRIAARQSRALRHATRGIITAEALERRVLLSATLYRVNAGGSLIADSPDWGADDNSTPSIYLNSASGSKAYSTSHAIDLSDASVPLGTPASMFQSQRYDGGGTPMQWDFPVTPGQYQVSLFFAEIGSGQQFVGARTFSVNIEGVTVLSNYDVYADVGGYKGVVKTFTVSADSSLDIEFIKGVQNPAVEGIQVTQVATAGVLSASVASLSFDPTTIGQSQTRSVTLTNLGGPGDPDITVSSTSILGSDPSQFSDNYNDALPVVLAPGQSTSFDVTFSPDSIGNKSATLQIAHTGTNPALSIDLSGTGTSNLPGPSVVYRVNAGGNVITDTTDWSADTNKNPSPYTNLTEAASKTYSTSNAIDLSDPSVPAGTPASLFQSQRYDSTSGGDMQWHFPVSPGQYEVRLYFAEIASGQQSVGARQFSVSIEGNVVLPSYDIYADVGGYKAVVKTFTVTSDSSLDIDFARIVQNPEIQGIEILKPNVANQLGVVPGQVDFGSVPINQQAQQTFTLTNLGNAGDPSITVNSTSITGTDAALFSDDFNDSSGIVLAPGQSTTVTVSFLSSATGGKSASLLIDHSGANTPLSIPLSATAYDPAQANQPPTVNAGSDQTITLPSGAALSGTATDDALPSGSTLTTTWSMASGPGAVTFANASALNTTVTFPAVGTYVLRLTASDGSLSTFDDMQVTVNGGSSVGFGKSTLSGASVNRPTSLQFGPDGRLYVAQQNGLIQVYTVTRNGAGSYSVSASETINLIQNIPNHDDNGALNTSVHTRLVTGLLVVGTAANPVIYACSSDPRIGGGGAGTDTNLDTNSGILSRLTWNGTQWVKQDLVRGLPRSEENHTENGLAYDRINNYLYVAVGGNTNMGAPSNNFAYLPEYALSACVLRIDLTAIGDTTYDLPTLDDQTRANNPDGSDSNDPFGGDNGLNQAMIVPGGPVQVYSPGYRNPYDIVITRAGQMYVIDNGSNAGWGDKPLDSSGQVTTVATEGDVTNSVSEPGVTYGDQLQLITGQGYYGGHPNPTRANLDNTFNSSDPQSPVPVADPQEGVYLTPGVDDGALALFSDSTNGLTEYTTNNFNGAMNGNLLAVSFDNKLYRIQLSADGTTVLSKTVLANNVDSIPLDVTASSATDPFPGTIWVADYQANQIVVFEPNDYDGAGSGGGGSGAYDWSLDDDHDGYSNADEIDNGTNPESAGDVPPDWNHNLLSDLNDPNDDSDSLPDVQDPFALDAQNGRATDLPVRYSWENEGVGAGGIMNLGWTGLMTNGTSNYLDQYDRTKMTAGGAAGVMTIDEVPSGTAVGSSNNQQYAFQFGVNVTSSSSPFFVHSSVLAPFAGLTPQDGQSIGIFLGTGDQDNFLQIAVVGDNGGGIKVMKEVGGVDTVVGQINLDLTGAQNVDLYLKVDPSTQTVTALYSLTNSDGTTSITPVGAPTAIPSSWLDGPTALAVGVIPTAGPTAPTFSATYDFIEVLPSVPNQLGISQSSVAFGLTQVGLAATQTIQLSNNGGPGDPDITINSASFSGSDASLFGSTFGGPLVLKPGDFYDLTLSFSPTAAGMPSATLNIDHTGDNSPTQVAVSGTAFINGLYGQYYNNTDLTGFASARTDAQVNFSDADLGSAPPGSGITPDDTYSMRWSGYVRVDTSGVWTFTTNSNDGSRLWVNGVQLVNDWTSHATRETSGSLNLQPGWYPITLEYFQSGGSAAIQLEYSGPNQAKTVIPSDHLASTVQAVSATANQLGTSASAIGFGGVITGQNVAHSITITNLGLATDPDITIDSTTIAGAGAAMYSDDFNDSSSVTLAPGQSITINVTFAPTATGTQPATLQINHSGSNNPLNIDLSGSGLAPGTSTSEALVVIDSGGHSTYSSGSFQITNNSADGQRITQVVLDLSSALLPDVYYDPNGTVGDSVGKTFTIDSDSGVGVTGFQFLKPGADGYQVLEITFNNFDPGETLTFSLDTDPSSIKDAPQPGPNDSASISGFELTGSTVTVNFDNGDTFTGQTFKTPTDTTGSQNTIGTALPDAPGLSVLGFTGMTGNTTSANQTVRVTGPVGANVKVLVAEAGLYLDGVPNGGYDIDPYEANSVEAIRTYAATIGAAGYVDVPVTLSKSNSEAGRNIISAVVVDGSGRTSALSPKAIIDLLDTGDGLLGASLSGMQFGNVATSTLLSRTLTLTNLGPAGSSSIFISGTSLSGLGASAFGNDFDNINGVLLAPGQSITFNVWFSPSSTGEQQATLSVSHDGSNTPLQIILEGTGV